MFSETRAQFARIDIMQVIPKKIYLGETLTFSTM